MERCQIPSEFEVQLTPDIRIKLKAGRIECHVSGGSISGWEPKVFTRWVAGPSINVAIELTEESRPKHYPPTQFATIWMYSIELHVQYHVVRRLRGTKSTGYPL